MPILELDCNKEFETDEAAKAELIQRVRDFLVECKTEHTRRRIEMMDNDKPCLSQVAFYPVKISKKLRGNLDLEKISLENARKSTTQT